MFLGGVIGRRGMTYTASSLWPCQKHYLKHYSEYKIDGAQPTMLRLKIKIPGRINHTIRDIPFLPTD
ncbi:hypothetical protein DSCO28_31680 [Desulfosarcina ovata subsp. sediminis]|uniref:Uncharacterized protein n=2 Tax=Desulfosarcina ovata TaxID=83564 RepID=A0A5K8AKV9_9BACT|nr:hypothetical protein DSCO28_31680 [Desulfosarcina ovata subsp. sediminis]BBO92430.1 hypothetical protein DSCOOX_56100 [Desulfosarcina ovata subsp. ovata]